MSGATASGGPCRICGRELPPEHPLSDLVGWPPPSDYGTFTIPGGFNNMPIDDEICAPCHEKLGDHRMT